MTSLTYLTIIVDNLNFTLKAKKCQRNLLLPKLASYMNVRGESLGHFIGILHVQTNTVTPALTAYRC